MKSNPFRSPKYVCRPVKRILYAETYDRTMQVLRNGKEIAIIIFIVNSDIPPTVRGNLLNGWSSLVELKKYCNDSGMAWFTCAK